jgi:hypothetical protein
VAGVGGEAAGELEQAAADGACGAAGGVGEPDQFGQLETLLPALVAAGFVESDEQIWNFTPSGVARVNERVPD